MNEQIEDLSFYQQEDRPVNLLVCGGYDYLDANQVYQSLDLVLEELDVRRLLVWPIPGASEIAMCWAKERQIPITRTSNLGVNDNDLIIVFPGDNPETRHLEELRKGGFRVLRLPIEIRMLEKGEPL